MNFMKNNEIVLLKSIFDSYDSNSDGFLSKGEFVAFSKEVLRISEQGGSNFVFKESDLNLDNRISFEEFVNLMEK
jgi:Ca2+-binding EF-hand superfamily protein